MVPVQFLGKIAAKHEETVAYVAPEFLIAENFSFGPGCLSAPEFELEQSVSGDVVPLCEEQIGLILRVYVRDPPSVFEDLHGFF